MKILKYFFFIPFVIACNTRQVKDPFLESQEKLLDREYQFAYERFSQKASCFPEKFGSGFSRSNEIIKKIDMILDSLDNTTFLYKNLALEIDSIFNPYYNNSKEIEELHTIQYEYLTSNYKVYQELSNKDKLNLKLIIKNIRNENLLTL